MYSQVHQGKQYLREFILTSRKKVTQTNNNIQNTIHNAADGATQTNQKPFKAGI